ncbi:tetratricopeptide repeat protein [Pseudomarimonas salicorniae]|uniref:Sel1 repeat family protein n=1 Tax=Pseudomarimonas salicorniae TaxID=2933270 RepID=A0ABT0GMT4_9GAMM|nr:tetratricopeptide repeat protein [Lysobacter sp. CAU 1642]MCK7595305.1 sel1 repeat family protein [Lysobacter sp. CAU 1642]
MRCTGLLITLLLLAPPAGPCLAQAPDDAETPRSEESPDRLQHAADIAVESALLQLGIDAAERGDFDTARQLLRRAAERGDAALQFDFARSLTDGSLGPADTKESAIWLRRAAMGGLAKAQRALANAYLDGVGVPQHAYAAKFWGEVALSAGETQPVHPVGTGEPDYEAELKRRASRWRLGNPGMPYAEGIVVFQPIPDEPDSPFGPLERWVIIDALPEAGSHGMDLLFSPELIARQQGSEHELASRHLRVSLDPAGSPISAQIVDGARTYSIQPTQLRLDLSVDTMRLSGSLATPEPSGPQLKGAYIELKFEMPALDAATAP